MLLFNAQIQSGLLAQYIGQAIDEAFDGNGFESHGVSMKLKRRGGVQLHTSGSTIEIKSASDIEVSKEMGLFSSEITGSIDIDISLEYDVSENFHLTMRSDITGHSWIEKPRLELGVLNVSVEKLTELALNHYESLITGRIDQSLRDRIRLREVIESQLMHLQNRLTDYERFGLRLYIRPKRLMMERPVSVGEYIHVKGGLIMDAEIAESDDLQPSDIHFQWLAAAAEGSLSFIDLKISEHTALQFVMDQLADQDIGGKPVDVVSASVQMTSDTLAIHTKISSPIKADVHVSGVPSYAASDQQLDLEEADVRVEAESLLYRISAPLVNKFVEAKINDFFPVGLAPFLALIKQALEKEEVRSEGIAAVFHLDDIRMAGLAFEQGCIKGKVQLTNAAVKISVDEGEVSTEMQ